MNELTLAQKHNTKPRALRPLGRARTIASLLLISTLAPGCGMIGSEGAAEPVTVTSQNLAGNIPTVKFDDLGGGSSVIQVYPGPAELPSDRVANGTYLSGDQMPAECVTSGRKVTSDAAQGERLVTSSSWVRLAGPQPHQYASLVYLEDPRLVESSLPICQGS